MFIYAILIVLPALIVSHDLTHLETQLRIEIDRDINSIIHLSEVVEFFMTFDHDSSKSISSTELSTAFIHLDPDIDALDPHLFNILDKNENGGIDTDDLGVFFNHADTDGDRILSIDEYHKIFAHFVSKLPY